MKPIERAMLAAGVCGFLSIFLAPAGDPLSILIYGAIVMVLAFTLAFGLLRRKRVLAWTEARRWALTAGVCVFALGLLYVTIWVACWDMPPPEP